MVKCRRWRAKRPEKQELAKGARDEVRTPHDLGDLHRRVVCSAGELVTRQIILSPNEEVTEVHARDRPLGPEATIAKLHGLSVRDTESPVHAGTMVLGNSRQSRAAGAGVERLFDALMRRTEGAQNILPRAGAGIDETAGAQALEGRDVMIAARTLIVRREGSADIRPFTPVKPKPAQILVRRLDKLWATAGGVEVVIAQQEGAADLLRTLLRDPKSARVTEVKIASG